MSWRERISRRSFSPEGRRVVGVVVGSHFLNHMFLVLLPPIFGILVTEFDASLAELGFAVTVMGLVSTVLQIPFGNLSDNYSRTLTLFIGLVSASAGALVVGTAQDFIGLLAGQALIGVGIGAHHPAHYPLLSDATASNNRGWAFSIHDTAGHVGYSAAPALLIGVTSFPGLTWRDAFLLVAAVTVVYAVLSAVVLSRSVSDDVTRGGRSADGDSDVEPPLAERIRDQIRSLVRSPAVLALTVLALVASMAGWGFRSFTTVLLTDSYGYGLTTANTVLTLMFVGSAVATLLSGLLTDRLSATTIIIPAYAFIAGMAVVAGSQLVVPIVAAIAIVVGASAHSMANPPRNKLLDNLSTRGDLGVNFGVITVGVTLGGAIAPPLYGWIIEMISYTAAFYLIGAFGLLGSGVVVAIVRKYDTSGDAIASVSATDD